MQSSCESSRKPLVSRTWLERQIQVVEQSSPTNRKRESFEDWCGHCRIRTKDPKDPILYFERDRWFEEQRRFNEERSGRDLVLKGRQIGFSTLELMRGLHQASHDAGRFVQIVGHEHDLVTELFRTVRYAADGLREQGRLPRTTSDTVRQLIFMDLGSSIRVTEAGATEASAEKKGHSGTIHRLHGTEVSRWNAPLETLTGLLGAVPDSGEIVFESTANGASGWFYDTVMECIDGHGPYKFHFYPWFWHKAYRKKPPRGFNAKPADKYEELLRKLGCDDEQIAWWRTRVKALTLDIALEQFPPTPELAFRASGRDYMDQETLDWLGMQVHEPIERIPVIYKRKGYPDRHLGELVIYKRPHQGRTYVVGGDVSEGILEDAHSLHVIDVRTAETCAVFWSDRITAGDFGLAMGIVGRFYNNALLGPERNNNGHAAIQALTGQLEYSNIYTGHDGRPGWVTNQVTRPILFDEMESGCRGHAYRTADRQTVGELRSLIIDKDGKPRARNKGKKNADGSVARDDRVLSWAIGLQLRQTASVPRSSKTRGRLQSADSGGF